MTCVQLTVRSLVDTTARLVDWVFGRRPHSTLPQSGPANNRVNEPTPKSQKRKTASVGQSTNTRFASPYTRQHTVTTGQPISYIFDSVLLNIDEG